jgi:hypothetical protein
MAHFINAVVSLQVLNKFQYYTCLRVFHCYLRGFGNSQNYQTLLIFFFDFIEYVHTMPFYCHIFQSFLDTNHLKLGSPQHYNHL